jgi:oxygen-dependent protoporphyrinogen oxidase
MSSTERVKQGNQTPTAAERPDVSVVVVGGGLAGLAACAELKGHRVLLLEADDRLGGRIRSEPRGDYWLNWGAHLFGGPQTPVGEMIARYSVKTLPVEGALTSLAFDGKLVKGGPTALLRQAPLSPRARLAFATSGLTLLRYGKQYQRFLSSLEGRSPSEVNLSLHDFMNEKSFAQLIGPVPRELDHIYRAISNRAQAEPEELSAGAALSAFALVLDKKPSLTNNVAMGSGTLIEALAADLECDVITGARVSEVARTEGGVAVTYESDGTTTTVTAREAIVTPPPNVAAKIAPDLPEETLDALREIRFGPSIVMTLLTRERRAMPWDDVYSSVVPGKSFNMFFNQANAIRSRESERRPGGSLMIYASGGLGRRLLDESDEHITALFLRDLYGLFPELVGEVEETSLHRWEYATSYSHPGRAALQPALEKDLGSVTLAGDYLGGWFSDSAVLTGRDAAGRVRERLDTVTAAESNP